MHNHDLHLAGKGVDWLNGFAEECIERIQATEAVCDTTYTCNYGRGTTYSASYCKSNGKLR